MSDYSVGDILQINGVNYRVKKIELITPSGDYSSYKRASLENNIDLDKFKVRYEWLDNLDDGV